MKLTLALAFPAALAAAEAGAQTYCGERQAVVAYLAAEFGEHVVLQALSTYGEIYEVFMSPDAGTWTLLVSTPGGPSCLVDVGEWIVLPPLPPLPPQGEPS